MRARHTVIPLLAAALLAGCTSHRPPPSATPQPATGPVTIAPASPTGAALDPVPGQACQRFAAALFSADTTTDTGPGDATRRAAAYTTPPIAARMLDSVQDGRWGTWQAHQARLQTVVTAYTDPEQPPDGGTAAYRAARVSASPVGRDGWHGWTQNTIVYCTLTVTSSGWLVSGFTQAGLP
jgi:hypothetical protein